jgi:hypothetical protein
MPHFNNLSIYLKKYVFGAKFLMNKLILVLKQREKVRDDLRPTALRPPMVRIKQTYDKTVSTLLLSSRVSQGGVQVGYPPSGKIFLEKISKGGPR